MSQIAQRCTEIKNEGTNMANANKSSKKVLNATECQSLASKLTPVPVSIGGQAITASPKAYDAEKSVGWFGNGKVTVMIDGQPTVCQASLNLTVIGTKPNK